MPLKVLSLWPIIVLYRVKVASDNEAAYHEKHTSCQEENHCIDDCLPRNLKIKFSFFPIRINFQAKVIVGYNMDLGSNIGTLVSHVKTNIKHQPSCLNIWDIISSKFTPSIRGILCSTCTGCLANCSGKKSSCCPSTESLAGDCHILNSINCNWTWGGKYNSFYFNLYFVT